MDKGECRKPDSVGSYGIDVFVYGVIFKGVLIRKSNTQLFVSAVKASVQNKRDDCCWT